MAGKSFLNRDRGPKGLPQAEEPLAGELAAEESVAEESFVFDGKLMAGGNIRYRVLCPSTVSPTGLFFLKVLPPGASDEEIQFAQHERDVALARLEALLAGPMPTEAEEGLERALEEIADPA